MPTELTHVPIYDDFQYLQCEDRSPTRTIGAPFRRVTQWVTQNRKYSKSKSLDFSPIGEKTNLTLSLHENGDQWSTKTESIREVAKLLKRHASDDYCRALAERVKWRFEGPRLRVV